jgi:hypothetical protein
MKLTRKSLRNLITEVINEGRHEAGLSRDDFYYATNNLANLLQGLGAPDNEMEITNYIMRVLDADKAGIKDYPMIPQDYQFINRLADMGIDNPNSQWQANSAGNAIVAMFNEAHPMWPQMSKQRLEYFVEPVANEIIRGIVSRRGD